MLRGLYTATGGMIAQQRKHDTITNNIANLNTPGFKQGNAVSRAFPEMLIALMSGSGTAAHTKNIGMLNTGVMAEEDVSSYKQGDLQETKNPFDVALVSDIQVPGVAFDDSGKATDAAGNRIFQPQAFFTVGDAAGGRHFTRSGKFTANADGELVTPEGYKVLGRDGNPLVLVDQATGEFISNVKITPDGKFVDDVNGQPFLDANGQQMSLMISRVDNPNRLIHEGNAVFIINPGEENSVTPLDGNDQVQIRQGYLEGSNVDPAQSMVDLMTALRAYEANQKVIQYYDKSLDKAVNEVGRI